MCLITKSRESNLSGFFLHATFVLFPNKIFPTVKAYFSIIALKFPTMRFLAISAAFILLLHSCRYKDEIEVVNVNNEFTMAVPNYLKKEDELKQGAPFQYCNRFRNIYAVVFSDEKAKVNKDFSAYYKEQTQIIKNVLEKPGVNDSVYVEVGGATGIRTEIFGRMQGENVYYSHLLIETPQKYYQVCVWTRGEDRKLKYGNAIESLLLSFKLIK